MGAMSEADRVKLCLSTFCFSVDCKLSVGKQSWETSLDNVCSAVHHLWKLIIRSN